MQYPAGGLLLLRMLLPGVLHPHPAEILIQHLLGGGALAAGIPDITAVRLHSPGLFLVVAQRGQDLVDLCPGLRRPDLNERLYPAIQIPVEQIAGADEHPLLRSFSEAVYAGMLQPAAYHALHRDVFRLSRNTRPEAADPANEQLDPHPRLGALDELFHDLQTVHGIDLDGHPSGAWF